MNQMNPSDLQHAIDLARSSGLYTPTQIELVRERCNGFVTGKKVDDYEVLVSRLNNSLQGFLIFRKRALTEAAFEIGQVAAKDLALMAELLGALKSEVLKRSGRIIFTELPDLPSWQPILEALRGAGYMLAGSTPHLYAPSTGTQHYALHLDATVQNQREKPVAVQPPATNKSATVPLGSSTEFTIVSTSREHRSALLDITATTSVFEKDDQEIVQELLDIYLEKGVSEGYYFLSCVDGSDVIAYACYGPRASSEGTYDLYWICTDTRRRQQGAGRQLMITVEAQVLARGGYLVVLETSDTPPYTPTRKFYEALDYAQVVHIRGFYSDSDGLVIYAKYLKPVG